MAFPDYPKEDFVPLSAQARERAGIEEESICFRPWESGKPYPATSFPAQRAARCAQQQDGNAFLRFHMAVFRAFFTESQDIGDRQVLVTLAGEAGLDVERFTADYDSMPDEAVMATYRDARAAYEGWGIPLVIIGGHYPIAGASPEAVYRRAIELCLGGRAQ